jgi:hypothetical protein
VPPKSKSPKPPAWPEGAPREKTALFDAWLEARTAADAATKDAVKKTRRARELLGALERLGREEKDLPSRPIFAALEASQPREAPPAQEEPATAVYPASGPKGFVDMQGAPEASESKTIDRGDGVPIRPHRERVPGELREERDGFWLCLWPEPEGAWSYGVWAPDGKPLVGGMRDAKEEAIEVGRGHVRRKIAEAKERSKGVTHAEEQTPAGADVRATDPTPRRRGGRDGGRDPGRARASSAQSGNAPGVSEAPREDPADSDARAAGDQPVADLNAAWRKRDVLAAMLTMCETDAQRNQATKDAGQMRRTGFWRLGDLADFQGTAAEFARKANLTLERARAVRDFIENVKDDGELLPPPKPKRTAAQMRAKRAERGAQRADRREKGRRQLARQLDREAWQRVPDGAEPATKEEFEAQEATRA